MKLLNVVHFAAILIGWYVILDATNNVVKKGLNHIKKQNQE